MLMKTEFRKKYRSTTLFQFLEGVYRKGTEYSQPGPPNNIAPQPIYTTAHLAIAQEHQRQSRQLHGSVVCIVLERSRPSISLFPPSPPLA